MQASLIVAALAVLLIVVVLILGAPGPAGDPPRVVPQKHGPTDPQKCDLGDAAFRAAMDDVVRCRLPPLADEPEPSVFGAGRYSASSMLHEVRRSA